MERFGGRRETDDAGAVTAEAAMVLPLLAVVAMGLAWMVGLGVAQGRAQDAAREAARVVARGDAPARARALARRVAPRATVSVQVDGGRVVVEVEAPLRGPGGVFAFVGHPSVTARSVAAREEAP
ncbi:MAG: TadE family type IV pilus minor pilin [Marmoricola sp.]